jgi:hypothetical protein
MLPSNGEIRGMYRPYKTMVKFKFHDGNEQRVQYLVSAGNSIEAKCELERRFHDRELFEYKIENVVEATRQEAAFFDLPAGCIQVLG